LSAGKGAVSTYFCTKILPVCIFVNFQNNNGAQHLPFCPVILSKNRHQSLTKFPIANLMQTSYQCLPNTVDNTFKTSSLCSGRSQNAIGQFRNQNPGYAGKYGSQYNKALNYLILQAMAGTYQNTTPQYPGMFLSNRPLTGPENASAVADWRGHIIFRWLDNSGTPTACPNDKVFMITYLSEIKKMIYTLHTATRANSMAVLAVDKWKGNTTENWIGFVSGDERATCDCVYVGSIHL